MPTTAVGSAAARNGDRISCTPPAGGGFVTAPLDSGEAPDTALVGATADGRADYCRLSAARALCTSFGGAAFASGQLDPGAETGRAWADHNGDGKADYRRQVGDLPDRMHVSCTISNGSGFGLLPQLDPEPTPNPAPQADPPRPAPGLALGRCASVEFHNAWL